MERIVVGQERLTVPGAVTRRQSSSQLSDLAEYVFADETVFFPADAS